jgi:nicotinamidase/pyrazinamidase
MSIMSNVKKASKQTSKKTSKKTSNSNSTFSSNSTSSFNSIFISQSALVVIDMQNDFLPGGSLAVAKGNEIIDPINSVAKLFYDSKSIVVFTQDWHPIDHLSFAKMHAGKKSGDLIEGVPGIGPLLWPDHCVQNTKGAEIHKDIHTEFGICIFRKGFNPKIDSYSTFFENDKKTKTGLAGYLRDKGIKKVFICGVALDYCCYYSAMDAKTEGFDVYFVQDLTRGIDLPPGNISNALNSMKERGIHIINKSNIEN